jgi:hypothetical protein
MRDTRFAFALFAVGGLFAVACAARPDGGTDFVVNEGNLEGQPTSETPASKDDEGETDPEVVEETHPTSDDEWIPSAGDGETVDAGTPAPMPQDAGKPAPKPEEPKPPTTVTKSQSCTSKYGSHRSVSKLTWTVTGSQLKIKSLYVQVSNSVGRNKNDVDVWALPPGSYERKAFNSGDILSNGTNKNVPWSYSLYPKDGERFRIETNFDQEGGDPSASCSVYVRK